MWVGLRLSPKTPDERSNFDEMALERSASLRLCNHRENFRNGIPDICNSSRCPGTRRARRSSRSIMIVVMTMNNRVEVTGVDVVVVSRL